MVLLFSGAIESVSSRETGSKITLASASDLLFVPAGETHASQYKGQVHGFYIQFKATWWERMQLTMTTLETTQPYQNCPASWLARRLYREFHQGDNLTPLMLEALTVELLITMARAEPDSKALGSVLPRWLNQVREYLHAHFTEEIALAELARAAGVHLGHLTRAFRQHFHCTIGEYVRQLRVQHACRLLTNPYETGSLAQIAQALGFADQSHFCRTFKRITGLTPTEMRNRPTEVIPVQEMRVRDKT